MSSENSPVIVPLHYRQVIMLLTCKLNKSKPVSDGAFERKCKFGLFLL
jgi:hypothetical protein